MQSVIIIGPDGAGKTTLVRALAQAGFTAGDVDLMVADTLEVSLADMYTVVDSHLRYQVMASIVRALFDDIASESDSVFALALPADFFEYRDLSEELEKLRCLDVVLVVGLEAGIDQLMKRLGLSGPRVTTIVLPRKELSVQLARRMPVYREHADEMIDTSRYDAQEAGELVAQRVIMLINNAS
ncbi:AAA family ATPase [Arcanobacterium buesumense]|uniref:ATPase AAA-type core domain-containing protein n=1 Tax=Arcanobacterium buesumense TaxID=2722751 RepID=A0A6H2EJL0_9ACTO|nr:shikimate kinase [Arcanobacterium buesumense]QJC21755.1 hypothetical protein HC352_04035 [Arcanobacterium buesumense]